MLWKSQWNTKLYKSGTKFKKIAVLQIQISFVEKKIKFTVLYENITADHTEMSNLDLNYLNTMASSKYRGQTQTSFIIIIKTLFKNLFYKTF